MLSSNDLTYLISELHTIPVISYPNPNLVDQIQTQIQRIEYQIQIFTTICCIPRSFIFGGLFSNEKENSCYLKKTKSKTQEKQKKIYFSLRKLPIKRNAPAKVDISLMFDK